MKNTKQLILGGIPENSDFSFSNSEDYSLSGTGKHRVKCYNTLQHHIYLMMAHAWPKLWTEVF
jgi:hypothetical protein